MARDFGPPEMMAIALARLLYPFETVFHGVASPLPAVAVRLARELNPPGPVYLSLAGGVDARPSGRGGSTCSADYLDGSVSRFGLKICHPLLSPPALPNRVKSGELGN